MSTAEAVPAKKPPSLSRRERELVAGAVILTTVPTRVPVRQLAERVGTMSPMESEPEPLASGVRANAKSSICKKRCLVLLFIYPLVFGAAMPIVPQDSAPGIAISRLLVLALFLTALLWCHYDSLERGFWVSKTLKAALVLLFAVAFPYYIFRTRGVAGFKTLGRVLLVLAAMAVLCLTGASVTFFFGTLIGLPVQD